MKKIPTLFKREFEGHKVAKITSEVHPGMEWVLEGEGEATEKVDGSCCAIIDGKFYKRYDAKKGKKPPEGAIPCCEADPVTGHHPHWVPVDRDAPENRWLVQAYVNSLTLHRGLLEDGTYEAYGPAFNGNPEGARWNELYRHGNHKLRCCPRDFEGIKEYLRNIPIEGVVFWKDGEPQCKIRRKDFGFDWPVR